jgi:thioredoxin-like negative regulator of GroEL
LSRSELCSVAIAATLGVLMLAGCGTVQASSASTVGTEQTALSASPNIAALQVAEEGRLEQPAFVEFYSDDCDICRRIQGPMRTLDLKYDGKIKFIYVDIDLPESQPSVRRFDVRGLPMFVLLNLRGDAVAAVPGWPGEDAVTASLNQLLAQQ